MATRILSGVIGFPLLALLVAYGGRPLLVANSLLAMIGMREIYAALSNKKLLIHFVGYIFALILYLIMDNTGGMGIMMLCSLFMISLMIILTFQHPNITIIDCAITFFGFFYAAFLLSFIYLVRSHSYGKFFVWLIFICAFGCDTFAYFSGLAFGKHKLAPVLSPKKTVEGAIGGVLGAVVIAFVYGFAVSRLFFIEDVPIVLFCTISGAVGAVFAEFGDLAASAIKRYTQIKDFGKLIPGHGGVMDRFDSVLFTAPAVYLVMMILLS